MTSFQEFRRWTRRASTGQRASATAATLVLVTLLVWALIPVHQSVGTHAIRDNVGTTAASYPATAPSPAPRRSGCVNAVGAVPGVTGTQIKVAVVLGNITGIATNKDFGVQSKADQQKGYQAVIDSINKAGGVDCRQIVPEYFTANAADQANLQQTCLNVVDAGVFAVVDTGAYASFPVVDCFAQHRVPYFGGYLLPAAQMAQFYPYLFELNSVDVVDHDTVLGLARIGFYQPANGFRKLGLIYSSCHPEIHAEELKWLAQAHVSPTKIVQFNAGCTTAFTSSTVLQQAILKFKHEHVTNVTTLGIVGDFPALTNLSEAQRFRPKYGVPDDALITTSYGSNRPNAANIDGAIAITASRDGEEHTPSSVQTPTTMKCSSLLGKSVYNQPVGAGNTCDLVWMFAAAVDHAPTLARSSLADGLKAAKSVDFSYPQGPNDFEVGTEITYAGQYWRTTQFHESCQCWQVIDPTFRPSAQ